MKLVKLFTHTDFDGISCAILAKIAFGEENVDIEYCDYNNINEKIETFYCGSSKNIYDEIFITDISVNSETANIIEYYKDNEYYPKTILLDHHSTALELNKYDWAKVQIMLNDKDKISGTRMFYDYLIKNNLLKQNDVIFDFVETVRKYDTWEWQRDSDIIPKQWNDLLGIMDRDEFIDSIIYRLNANDEFAFCDFDLKLLKYKQREIDAYVESKKRNIIVKNILGYKAGIVFGEKYQSELGNKLCTLHPELDFVAIIDMNNEISYRSIGTKLDLGKEVAAIYRGGGHPNAAGSPINDKIREQAIDLLFK